MTVFKEFKDVEMLYQLSEKEAKRWIKKHPRKVRKMALDYARSTRGISIPRQSRDLSGMAKVRSVMDTMESMFKGVSPLEGAVFQGIQPSSVIRGKKRIVGLRPVYTVNNATIDILNAATKKQTRVLTGSLTPIREYYVDQSRYTPQCTGSLGHERGAS